MAHDRFRYAGPGRCSGARGRFRRTTLLKLPPKLLFLPQGGYLARDCDKHRDAGVAVPDGIDPEVPPPGLILSRIEQLEPGR